MFNKRTYADNNKPFVFFVEEHLKSVRFRYSATFAFINGPDDNVVDFFGRPQLLQHARSG
jgi:hypothetical protein